MDELQDLYERYRNPSNFIFVEENFLRYKPGGFHPIALGDTLKAGRYKIHHKLGYGGFSTVWLARNCWLEQWVSVKITRADGKDRFQELESLRALAQHSTINPGFEYIVKLLDEFVHEGPNGSHQCLVFELLGPTLDMIVDDAHYFKERLDSDTIVRLSTQILEAVVFIHKAGYAHGDLSAKKVAFYNPRLSKISEEELLDAVETPDARELIRSDGEPLGKGIPVQLIETTKWTGWPLDDDEDDEIIRIIDLGEAFSQDAVPEKPAQPPHLRAPEPIFTDKIDHRIDLWCVGFMVRISPLHTIETGRLTQWCQIYKLVFRTLPYSWWGLNELIETMIDVFENLPPQWEPKWEQMKSEAVAKGDYEAGKWKHSLDFRLEKQFDEDFHAQKLKGLLPVIQGLTRLLPTDRISASDALQLVRDNFGSIEGNENSEDD